MVLGEPKKKSEMAADEWLAVLVLFVNAKTP
jgi:hypothetical protein